MSSWKGRSSNGASSNDRRLILPYATRRDFAMTANPRACLRHADSAVLGVEAQGCQGGSLRCGNGLTRGGSSCGCMARVPSRESVDIEAAKISVGTYGTTFEAPNGHTVAFVA